MPRARPLKLAVFHDVMAHRAPSAEMRVFSYLKRYGELPTFTNQMNEAFPEIREIDLLPYPDASGGVVSSKTSNGRWLPLSAYGDGVRRWYYLLGQMLAYQQAVHCIEEMESTIHPEAQAHMIRGLVRYVETTNNQIFASSHSIEFLDHFLKSLYSDGNMVADDFVRIFTLSVGSEGEVEVWPLSGREAYEKRHKYGLEVR
jgi:hypothetical protein